MDADERQALAGLRFDSTPTEKTLWGGELAHVDGLNQDVYDRVREEICALPLSRKDSPAGLVVHGEYGSGKSHLMWWARRFIARMGTGGYYFNVQPDGNAETLWTRVVASMLYDLQEPIGHDESGRAITQVGLFVERLSKLFGLPDRARRVLSGIDDAEPAEIRSHLKELVVALRRDRPGLGPRNVARALVMLAVTNEDANVAGESYLRDSPDELEARHQWGLRPARPDQARELVDHLSSLLALTGPALFVVDQIDELVVRSARQTQEQSGADESTDLAAALMTIREKLTRSLTIVSCLDHTWRQIKTRSMGSALDRFPVELALQPIGTEAAQRLATKFLSVQYQELGFVPPHPTWPVPPEAFGPITSIRPRKLIQLIHHYVRSCLDADTVLPLADITAAEPEPVTALPQSLPDPTASTQERFLSNKHDVQVDSLKGTSAEHQLGSVLAGVVWALVVEVGSDHEVTDTVQGAEKSSVHCEVEVRDGSRVCLRGINTAHAPAIGSRVDRALEYMHSGPGSDPRLVIVRTQAWRETTRVTAARGAIRDAGGTLIAIDDAELRTLAAVHLTTNDRAESARDWLRRHRPVSATELGRTLLRLFGDDVRAVPSEPATQYATVSDDTPVSAPSAETGGRPAPTDSVPGAETIPLGRDTTGDIVSLELESLRKHIAVFASSGSGKTVLLRRVIEECALRGVSTIVLDPNNDLARLGDPWPQPPDGWWPGDADRASEYLANTDVVVWTPGVSKGNPLTLQPFPDFTAVRDDPDELRLAVETAVASLAPRARITGETHVADGRRAVLRETLLEFARNGGGDLSQLIDLLLDPPTRVLDLPSGSKHANFVASGLSYARSNDALFDGDGTPFDPDRLLTPADGFRARVSVINLAGVPEEARPAFINRLQMALFSWIKRHPAKDKPLSGLFIMDEAQTFIPSGRSTPCTESTRNLASQARKYGLGLVYATQAPRGIDSRITGNAATHVYGKVTVPAHVGAVNDMARARGESAPTVSRLEAGRFFISLEGHRMTEVTVPICLSHHGAPLEEPEIAERARGRI